MALSLPFRVIWVTMLKQFGNNITLLISAFDHVRACAVTLADIHSNILPAL
jgi:hypothetical protein